MPARPVARHRAARRPLTALDDLAAASADGMASAGRRSAVAVITSGLVMSMSGTPAFAARTSEVGAFSGSVDTSRLTQSARAVLEQQVVAPVERRVDLRGARRDRGRATPRARSRSRQPQASRSRERAAHRPRRGRPPRPLTAEPAVAVPASAHGNAIVEIAARYVGVPYVYGGTTPDGFDCSGFTSYVFAQVGISLPRTSSAQRTVGTVVSRADAQPGDLIWSPGHIAIYAGDGLQVDAPRPGQDDPDPGDLAVEPDLHPGGLTVRCPTRSPDGAEWRRSPEVPARADGVLAVRRRDPGRVRRARRGPARPSPRAGGGRHRAADAGRVPGRVRAGRRPGRAVRSVRRAPVRSAGVAGARRRRPADRRPGELARAGRSRAPGSARVPRAARHRQVGGAGSPVHALGVRASGAVRGRQ